MAAKKDTTPKTAGPASDKKAALGVDIDSLLVRDRKSVV